MIRLSALLGDNPIRHHSPVRYINSSLYVYSIGQFGQIVAWLAKSEEFVIEKGVRRYSLSIDEFEIQQVKPVYQIVPSVIADTDQLIDMIVTPVHLIRNEVVTDKIVTIHEDGRLRLYNALDGVCINVSQHNFLPQKAVGLVKDEYQNRFLLCFSDKKVYVIDSWTLKIVDCLQPKIQSYSILTKGRINQKKELELMDRQQKSYRLNIAQLFDERHLDVGSWISNLSKSYRLLKSTMENLKQEKTVSSYRKIHEPLINKTISKIQQYLQAVREGNIWKQIFDEKYHGHELIAGLINSAEQAAEWPTVSNCFYLKSYKLWYFFGTNRGRILALPVVSDPHKLVMAQDVGEQVDSPVVYLNFFENLLVVSWENGRFSVYGIDNLDYLIQAKVQENERLLQEGQGCKYAQIDLNQNRMINQMASAQIKYQIQMFCSDKTKHNAKYLAFQLLNNEVLLLDSVHRKISNYRGIPESSRIYVVLEVNDYTGIAHAGGIDMYSAQGFERTIPYEQWVWNDFQFCEKVKCKHDYHNITATKNIDEVSALQMFEYESRRHRHQIDYYSFSQDFLYETFGMLDTEQMGNQTYPAFHFIQKLYTERAIHSACQENAGAVVRLKHNNIRRQKLSNTAYMLTVNLNRQLEGFSNSQEIPLSEMQRYYGLFSLFFWDVNRFHCLSELYHACPHKFIFARRYTEQGIGKSFTIYFDNKSKHELSSDLLTVSVISSVVNFYSIQALLQICSTKDFEMADEMVRVAENFTVKQNKQSIKLDVSLLSELSISDNQYIVKACINILMSAALTQVVPFHPLYEYFILNAKNIEETKQKTISEAETIWFVYLGIGFIYSTEWFNQDQVKTLIMRLIETIDIVNFEKRPDLIIIILKVFNEGVRKWKGLISSNIAARIFADLFRIYFCYDAVRTVAPDDKKFNFCFEGVGVGESKKMKQQIIKTIIYLSKEFENEFLQVLRVQALNQKHHPAFPASVVEILRQCLKNERPSTNLVFFIELLLQCLSPMTPNLRKFVQKNVLATLQFMCTYENISFNHPSQKLSLRTDSNIYIYCLRTSTKWRTISLKNEKATEKSLLEMSPKGTYIALLTDKLKIWRLSSGFWSGVLGAFSQGWTFEAQGIALKWDQREESITVINENPSLNQCFKL